MHQRPLSLLALFAVLAGAVAAPEAAAGDSLLDRIQSGIDGVARGFTFVGRKAEDWIGPGLGIGEEPEAAHTETRLFSERYPVGATPLISIENEFGEIRVTTWDDRVVQVAAEIRVGAESADVAAEIARAIDINVAHAEDLVEVRTFLPDTRRDWGMVAIEVNYTLTIPRSASLLTENFFGDTIVRGVGGLLAIEAQYGMVDLADIAGPVQARVHGEFPVRAHGLARGGVFHLHGAQADFREAAGELRVNNFRGRVLLRDLAPECDVSVQSDSGPVHVMLPPEALPDLSATVIFGTLQSDMPLTRTAQRNKLVARNPNAEASQRIAINVNFGDVRIEREGEASESAPRPADGAKPFNDVLTRTVEAFDAVELDVDAAVGDVRVEGVAGDAVHVAATRIVWVDAAAAAPEALDALQVEIERDEAGRVRVVTGAAPGETPGDRAYRVDLAIQVPRNMPVSIRAADGLTSVHGLAESVRVEQAGGVIEASSVTGAVRAVNQNGDIIAEDCAGAVEAIARYGRIHLLRVGGPINVENAQGTTVIESPGGDVFARNTGGPVRILALEGVEGSYDVLAENGDVSLVVHPNADAAFTLVSANGAISSGIPLAGRITRDTQEFDGRLRDGRHRIRLETRNGNIYLD